MIALSTLSSRALVLTEVSKDRGIYISTPTVALNNIAVTMTITFAATDAEIEDCYDVMSQLRPHVQRADFVPRVRRQMDSFDFKLAYLKDDDDVKAVAGIRVSEWLHRGKYLEIDDLVAKDGDRSKGYGGQLFDWIVEYARSQDCAHIRLLSGVQRFDAHRFYLRKRMNIEAHYFSMDL